MCLIASGKSNSISASFHQDDFDDLFADAFPAASKKKAKKQTTTKPSADDLFGDDGDDLFGGVSAAPKKKATKASKKDLPPGLDDDGQFRKLHVAVATGFPRNIESIENILNCEVSFQHLEKVLNLAKMCIKC